MGYRDVHARYAIHDVRPPFPSTVYTQVHNLRKIIDHFKFSSFICILVSKHYKIMKVMTMRKKKKNKENFEKELINFFTDILEILIYQNMSFYGKLY